MTKLFSSALLACVLLGACACACGPSVKPTLKIGLAAPFEGQYRALGYEALYGAQLAVTERNQAGGVGGYLVELVALNDDQDPSWATQRAREMGVDSDVMGVIGHLGEQTTEAAIPIYQGLGLPLVVPLSSAGATPDEGQGAVFRLVADKQAVGAVGARYAVLDRSARRVAVVGEDQELAEAFAAYSRSLGADVYVHSDPRDEHLVSELSREAPQLVFLVEQGVEAGEFVLELAESGLRYPILGGPGLDTPQFVQVAGEAALGTVYLSHAPPLSEGPFFEAYEALWASKPGARAALAYDASGLLLEALERLMELHGRPSRAGLAESLAALKDYQGVTGRISFDNQGQAVEREVFLYEMVALEYPGQPLSCESCGS
ncbi:MAG: branched-chain amino acid ABC transporter substrate-binding protein [Anaerolineae bacterium]|nr:branched-chain amino acid ABC transporter substrate-binding protein [Anaerolineae bacterium]